MFVEHKRMFVEHKRMKIYFKIFYIYIVVLVLHSNVFLYANQNKKSYTKLVDKAVTFSNFNHVFELKEDNAYIWAATLGGVVKYDKNGNLIKYYTTSDGLVSNIVRSINIDHEGNKWFSVWGSGISMFDGSDWKLYNEKNTSFFIDYAQKIRIINDGSILFAMFWGDSVALFKKENWIIIEPENELNLRHVNDALYDQKKNLYIASETGVFKYDGNKWERVNESATTLELDPKNGALWFSDNVRCSGVRQYDGTNWSYYSDSDGLVNNCISSIAIDASGNKWFGSALGVSKYDEDKKKWTTYTQENNIIIKDVNDIIIDSEGTKWFGTDNGIIKYDNTTWKSFTFKNSSPIHYVGDAAQDIKGNIWVTHSNNNHSKAYLSKYDGTEWKLTKQFELEDGFDFSACSMSIDRNNKFWFSGNRTYNSNKIFSYDGLIWKEFSSANGLAFNSINDLKIDFENNIWVVSSNSVAMYNGNDWITFNSSSEGLDTEFEGGWLSRIAIDTNGSVWYLKHATYNKQERSVFGIGQEGISFVLYEYKNKKWYKYSKYVLNERDIFRVVFRIDNDNTKWIVTNSKVLKFDGINWDIIDTPPYNFATLEIDNKGIKWFGTYGNGILKLDGTKWTEYNTSCGLNSNDISDVFALRSGGVLAASYYSISKLIPVPFPKADINEDGNVDVKDLLNVIDLLSCNKTFNTKTSLKSNVTNKDTNINYTRSDINNDDKIGFEEVLSTMDSLVKNTHKLPQRLIASVLFNISLTSIDDPMLGANYYYNNYGDGSSQECNGYYGGHSGVDMQTKDVAGSNTATREFYSLSSGEVITSGVGPYNTIAVYNSEDNKTTIYLHARSVNVTIGDVVSIGSLLGVQGDTGSPGSEHVHVEVRSGKKTGPACGACSTVDPINYLYDNVRYENIEIPDGFKLIQSAKAVQLYKKNYSGGEPDYVQVINLENGARIKLLYGSIESSGYGEGIYGGNNPKFKRQTILQFWSYFYSNYENAFSIVNGQFFKTDSYPTDLAFPLKVEGQIISDGYGISEYTNQKLLLEIWDNKVNIKSLTKQNLMNSSASNILAGLTEDANKEATNRVGRTFAGIKDANNNGSHETLLIFTSSYSKQAEAANVLRSFGASRIIMFDGGGSTQLICEDVSYVSSSRAIPQVIGVISIQ